VRKGKRFQDLPDGREGPLGAHDEHGVILAHVPSSNEAETLGGGDSTDFCRSSMILPFVDDRPP
jgi:hypothetical protein